MFSLRDTLLNRRSPPGYNPNMGIALLCGRRPVSITCLRNSPCPKSVIVHFKSLLPIDNNVNQFINSQFNAMQWLFAEGSVAVLRGSTEDLSSNIALEPLKRLDIGYCLSGNLTRDQITLFANRNNVSNNELVIYVVSAFIGGHGDPTGCAIHPIGQPGAVVKLPDLDIDRWLIAHEVGHLLGLDDVEDSESLMNKDNFRTKIPPNVAASEYAKMLNSFYTKSC